MMDGEIVLALYRKGKSEKEYQDWFSMYVVVVVLLIWKVNNGQNRHLAAGDTVENIS